MAGKKKVCCECSDPLTRDEVALSKKLLGLEIKDFYCVECLAEFLECSVEDLRIKIEEFKEQGCSLFR